MAREHCYTFCCHIDAFCYLLSDQVATTCYLQKKLISNTVISLNSEVGTNLLGEILPPILQILAHYL